MIDSSNIIVGNNCTKTNSPNVVAYDIQTKDNMCIEFMSPLFSENSQLSAHNIPIKHDENEVLASNQWTIQLPRTNVNCSSTIDILDTFNINFYAKFRHIINLPPQSNQINYGVSFFSNGTNNMAKKLIVHNNNALDTPINIINLVLKTCCFRLKIIITKLIVTTKKFYFSLRLENVYIYSFPPNNFAISNFLDGDRTATIKLYRNLGTICKTKRVSKKETSSMLKEILSQYGTP